MKKRDLFLLGLLAMISSFLKAENIGDFSNPYILNYDNTQYNASTQNWCIEQDNDYIMWFGNVGRVLWYDGSSWGSVDIPNASIVRSLSKLNDNTIMAGAFSEFGSIEKDEFGQLYFRSWLNKLPDNYRNFTDVWNIHELNNTLYIQTFQYLFVFRDGEFKGAYESQNSFRFSFVSNGQLFIEEVGSGLKVLTGNELIEVEGGSFFSDKSVWYLAHAEDQLLVGTREEGLYIFSDNGWKIWNQSLNNALNSQVLFCGLKLSENRFLFGTVKNGVILTDSRGNIEKSISRNNGLQNNTVLDAFADHEGNLWLGLDRGIDYILYNYQFQLLSSKGGFGTGYAAIEHDGLLYLGTNQGVYTWSESAKDFAILPGTAGQVWTFSIINDQLYCGHDKGIFSIKKNKATLEFQVEGVWKIEQVPDSGNLYIAGTYNGLHMVRFGANKSSWSLDGFNESCRIFEFDTSGFLWMSHGYKGVYRIKIDNAFQKVAEVTFFGLHQGLPLNINNEVFKYKDEIYVAGNDGFYRYNESIGLMEAYELWNRVLPLDHPVSKVLVDKWERINFFNGEKISWAIFQGDSLTYFDDHSFIPLKNKLFYAFENIYFADPVRAIIGNIDGFSYYLRDRQFSQQAPVHLKIKHIRSLQGRDGASNARSLEIGKEMYKLPYQQNSLQIELSVPAYQNHEFIEIEFSIDNQELAKLRGDFTIFLQDLEHRSHTVEILARDLARNITSEPILLKFMILAPWYKRWYAFLAYAVIIVFIIIATAALMRRYFETVRQKEQKEQRKRMEEQQQRLQQQAEEAERQLIVMRNEKLSMENRIKAEEIANSTMELVHKNKMLLDVKETLRIIQKEKDIDSRNATIKGIVKKIDKDLDNEEKWTVFEKNFDEIHENFLNRLKETHPLLTSKDLRLCAYLRMNLSSKEIAPLLRISVRSVEISRYRLRKKLDLPREQSLSDYILLF